MMKVLRSTVPGKITTAPPPTPGNTKKMLKMKIAPQSFMKTKGFFCFRDYSLKAMEIEGISRKWIDFD